MCGVGRYIRWTARSTFIPHSIINFHCRPRGFCVTKQAHKNVPISEKKGFADVPKVDTNVGLKLLAGYIVK